MIVRYLQRMEVNLNHQPRPRRKNHEEIERRSQPRPKHLNMRPWKPKKSTPSQLLLKLLLLNQLPNLTNLLQLKTRFRKTPNIMLLKLSIKLNIKLSTKRQKSQSIKTPAKKLLPSSTNSSPRSTTSVDSKSSSPDKRRRLRSTTKRTTSSKSNSSLVLRKIN